MSNLSDPIGDFLTRLRNASTAGNAEFRAPYSKMKASIAEILKTEGYITDFEINRDDKFPVLKVTTKRVNRGAAITGIKRISKPGLRKYVGVEDIPKVLGGMGVAILSTSKGIFTGREARYRKLGGEVLAIVW